MKEKECFKCGEVKPLSEFYKHAQMADGHVNKCKECNKKDVRKNRAEKLEYYRKYDRDRGNRQDSSYMRDYYRRFPKKCRARSIVARAVRKGDLVPEPCEICNSKPTHAHHDDYDKPLNIRWLCPAHHREWHDKNGEGKNASG